MENVLCFRRIPNTNMQCIIILIGYILIALLFFIGCKKISECANEIYWGMYILRFTTAHQQSVSNMQELIILLRRRRTNYHRRYWVHPTLLKRPSQGEFHQLVNELRVHPDRFFTYFRMTPNTFNELLSICGPRLVRQDTNCRKAISPSERLAITFIWRIYNFKPPITVHLVSEKAYGTFAPWNIRPLEHSPPVTLASYGPCACQ